MSGATAVQSMTGFGEASGSHGATSFAWTLRSLNGKGLDVRMRVPPGMDGLDPVVRAKLARAFARGSVQVALSVERPEAASGLRVNEAALAEIVAMLREASERHGLEMPDAGRVLQMRGVLESGGADALDDELRAAMAQVLDEAVAALREQRLAEGERLAEILRGQIDEIGKLAQAAFDDPSRSPERIAERLAEQIARVRDERVDRDRLHQEAAILAVKADPSEEIDRLRAHVDSARELLSEGGPVGRRLEFLAQEFGREANTLASKANAPDISAIGLALKVVVDRFREQVANVE